VKRFKKAKNVRMSAGDVVKIAAELLEMPRKKLAKRMGIYETDLSNLLNSKRRITVEKAVKFAKILELDPAFIIFKDKKARKNGPKK